MTESAGAYAVCAPVAVDGPPGSRNGYGKPRWLAPMSRTIEVRRPRIRGLEERFESRILPLFQRRTHEVTRLLRVPAGGLRRTQIPGRPTSPSCPQPRKGSRGTPDLLYPPFATTSGGGSISHYVHIPLKGDTMNRIITIALLTVACGQESPTKPVPPEAAPSIVGSWKLDSNNFLDEIKTNFKTYLVDHAHFDPELASQFADVLSASIAEDILPLVTLTFKSDFTYSEQYRNFAQGGTWSVTGDQLTLKSEDDTWTSQYSVSETRLTLEHSKEFMVEVITYLLDAGGLDEREGMPPLGNCRRFHLGRDRNL